MDGAHNLEAIETLIDTMKSFEKKPYIIFSALQNKPIKKMLRMLSPHCEKMILTSFQFPKAEKANVMFSYLERQHHIVIEDWQRALEYATDQAKKNNRPLVITGSLYFISEVRKFLINK
ncbi:hypothetical protein LC087_08350 [Bacillus carboniphilus]|uniref:Mur ligase C-terminal domain-containing protein n=1 Tax=Bacillus carboniphilus TaxID=86663 RepID=A0ABY9JXH0_9BACI|nr:hypothetical protein [Bacillus carboniphilus]WLR44091.1 hypothetical protein LC087_08350 [Bacillus carboniphilus]